jgi:hypothetical protein
MSILKELSFGIDVMGMIFQFVKLKEVILDLIGVIKND